MTVFRRGSSAISFPPQTTHINEHNARKLLEIVMRNMSNMMGRRSRYHGGQEVFSGYLRCDGYGCPKGRFESGALKVERKLVIYAICDDCMREGRVPFGFHIDQIVDPTFKRRMSRKRKRHPA